ncbi:MAG: S41 family peptidase [Planctomycetota bacterium]
MPRDPAVSPDGTTLAFAWQGDIWLASVTGGEARRLTVNAADDRQPVFHPNGQEVAFVSSRNGGAQIHVVPLTGGVPRQVTFDSARKDLIGYTADGAGFVVLMGTDRGFHYSDASRVFVLDAAGEKPSRMLLDVGPRSAALSPDGTKLLFTRGRSAWERKGYVGPQAEQLWVADLAQVPPALTRLDEDREGFQNVNHIQPFWAPDGQSYYYVSDPDGTFDVYHRRLDGSEAKRVTNCRSIDRSDDGVAFPALASNGRTLVFRRRFDLMRMDMANGALTPIALTANGDAVADALERRIETGATDVAFTNDGKQIAFIAGEDVWVMDRILREPRRVTDTPNAESGLVFSADGARLFFVSDVGGEVDVYAASHAREDGNWWLADEFEVEQLTHDAEVEGDLKSSPAGGHIAYTKSADIWVMDDDGTDHRRVVEAWSSPDYVWSPDGKWLAYATQDSDYNSDIFLTRLDGTIEPFNVSRHPDDDWQPAWSGDGKRLAFTSMRDGEESDVYWVDLTKESAEETARDRKLEEALEAMKKGGKGPRGGGAAEPSGAGDEPRVRRRSSADEGADEGGDADATDAAQAGLAAAPKAGAQQKDATSGEAPKPDAAKAAPPEVRVDFDGIFDRVRRISNPNSRESGLLWSPDGKTLAFNATVNGESGFYKVEFPDVGRPTRLAASGLSGARWLAETKEIVGLARGGGDAAPGLRRGGGGGGMTPAALSAAGKQETFGFSVRRVRDWRAVRQISFDQGWRAMRDQFYDPAMNHRDWSAIRAKYRPVAAQCLGASEFSQLMNMMLGELNASHMGHRGGSEPFATPQATDSWTPSTYHLGLRFVQGAPGPGVVVESVIPGGPTSRARSLVTAGETVLSIDGAAVGPDVDLQRLLTLEEERDVVLEVSGAEGVTRQVTVRPVRSVADLLYDEWVEGNRQEVERLSGGKLGYLHIKGMDFPSFRQLEEDLFHAGYGKEGLVIDVRFNGGGSTADHVLTALTQPIHAVTQSRGSGLGYPQDRKVYATWSKPIVMMCNEHSFSNAEIISHAIKQTGRGRLVGMRTAGGVISTGAVGLLDGSMVRMPGRGWYLATNGADMELNGCMPDIALWNPLIGPDAQLAAAVQALAEDVERAAPAPQVVPASKLRGGDGGGR